MIVEPQRLNPVEQLNNADQERGELQGRRVYKGVRPGVQTKFSAYDFHELLRIERCNSSPCFVVTGDLVFDENNESELEKLLNIDPRCNILVNGDFTVIGSQLFVRYPANLVVKGNLKFVECPNLESLSNIKSLKGDLVLIRCPSVPTLHDKLYIHGSLLVKECAGFQTLPKNLHVLNDVTISQCPVFSTIYIGSYIGGIMIIKECPALLPLPSYTYVNSDLHIHDIPSSSNLPQFLSVGGDLSISGLDKEPELHSGVVVSKGNGPSRYACSESYSNKFFVGGVLYIYESSVRQFPKKMVVLGNMFLDFSSGETRFPEELLVDGEIKSS